MVTLVGIKLVFIGMQIIFSTSEINSENEQMEIFVAAKMPYFTSHHLLHQKYACCRIEIGHMQVRIVLHITVASVM